LLEAFLKLLYELLSLSMTLDDTRDTILIRANKSLSLTPFVKRLYADQRDAMIARDLIT
jgi:hypothetical protein